MSEEEEPTGAGGGAEDPPAEVWPKPDYQEFEPREKKPVSGLVGLLNFVALLAFVGGIVVPLVRKEWAPFIVGIFSALLFAWMARVLEALLKIAWNTRRG